MFTGFIPVFAEPPTAYGILPVASFNPCNHLIVIASNEFATEVEVKLEMEAGAYPVTFLVVAYRFYYNVIGTLFIAHEDGIYTILCCYSIIHQ